VILISLVISAVGVFAIPQLKQQLFPSLSLPMVSVVTPYPGAPPETVEDQVTEPIENRLRSLDSVEELTSVSAENVSTVRVAFDYGNDPDELVNDIKAAVAEVENELPEGAEPQVVAGSTDDIGCSCWPSATATANASSPTSWNGSPSPSWRRS